MNNETLDSASQLALPARNPINSAGAYLLVIAGAIALIVAIWSGIDSQLHYEHAEAEERVVAQNETMARTFEEFVLRTLATAENLTKITETAVRYNGPVEAIRRAVETGVLESSLLQSLNFQDTNGDLIASTLPISRAANYADRSYFQEARDQSDQKLIVGAPVVSRLTGEAAIPIARRYNRADGSFGGVLLLQVSAKGFAKGYANFQLASSDYVALVGLDGAVRAARIGGGDMDARDFAHSNVLRAQRDSPSGHFLAKAYNDNIMRYVSYRTVPGYPLLVAAGTGEKEALRDFGLRKDKYLAAGTISTFLTSAFAIAMMAILWSRDKASALLRAREADLRELATHDSLTSLPNRTLVEASAAEKIASARRWGGEVACLYLDVNRLGFFNDAFGHPFGDDVIRSVGAAICDCVAGDAIVGRVGGDEFVIVTQPAPGAEQRAVDIANAIQAALAKLDVIRGTRVDVELSIGISVYPRDGESLEELMRCADAAMYISKASLHSVPQVFTKEMNRASDKRLKIRAELKNAIAKNELELFYQPKICLATDRPIGAEALVRWRHSERGLVSPAEFIPVAEESGLIIPLGEWVLNRACDDAKELNRLGFGNFPVAVNVSALQFRQSTMVQDIRRTIAQTGIDPSAIELELTESMVADDPETIVKRLTELKDLGVSIAIDDFGTGYSNLQYLRRFPIDVLKIDRSFVKDVPLDADAASIALAIISLGRTLGLKIVAEGVETLAQREFLMAASCQYGQGYLFAKPMPFAELTNWLARRTGENIVPFPLCAS